MKKIIIVILLLASPTFAQQQPVDPAVMQRVINSLQAQRNQALDAAASQEVRAVGLTEDLSKAQARIKELESKIEEKK